MSARLRSPAFAPGRTVAAHDGDGWLSGSLEARQVCRYDYAAIRSQSGELESVPSAKARFLGPKKSPPIRKWFEKEFERGLPIRRTKF